MLYTCDNESPSTNSDEEGNEGTSVRPGRKTDKERMECGQRREWTDNEILNLIKLWRESPILYDNEHPMYHMSTTRKNIIDQISEQLGINVKDVNDKMHSLRTYYGAQRQRIENSRKRNKDDKGYKSTANYPKWKFYEQMSFLYESVTLRAARCEANGGRGKKRRELMQQKSANETSKATFINFAPPIAVNGSEETETFNNYTDTQQMTQENINGSIYYACANKNQYVTEYENESVKSEKRHKPNEVTDSDELFGNLVICSLKEISDIQKKELLKLEIQKLIYTTRFQPNK